MVEILRVFSKVYGDRELLREGLENSREAREVGRGTEIFSVPRVVNADEQGLVIDFELLRSWRFRGFDRAELISVFGRIGQGIAEYHGAAGKIHGDLFPDNVLFRPGDPKISFVDFSRPDPPLHPAGRPYNHGTVYTDLALLTIFTLVKYPLSCLAQAFRAEHDRLFREGGVLLRSLTWRYLRWTPIFRIDDLGP